MKSIADVSTQFNRMLFAAQQPHWNIVKEAYSVG